MSATPRVVSLVPSITETLRAWGIDPVACTRFCEQPDLTHVGGTKDPDLEAIVALAPDLVVVDEEENERPDHDALVAAGLDVHVTAVRDLADVDAEMARLAAAVGVAWAPLHLDDPIPVRSPSPVRVAVPIWRRPWMVLGAPTYGTSVLSALGCVNVVDPAPAGAPASAAYPTIELDDLAARSVDLLVVPDEPYPFAERHRDELSVVAPVVFVDGKDLLWWGERSRHAPGRLGAVLRDAIAAP